MEALNLVQNSPEWHEHRGAHFNASDAPAMMGVSKYVSRDELLHRYKTGAVEEINPATQKLFDDGHKFERMARPIAEKIIGEELYPVTGSDIIDGLPLSASFDGQTVAGDIDWEHKSINADLRAMGGDVDQLDEMYKIQMDQQQLISGAAKTLFMASNGTEDDMVKCWYESTPDRIQAIIDGWKQFEKDLEAYEPPTPKPEAVAGAIEQLPALQIQITGAVNCSNLEVYRDRALAYIESINTDLQTDQDFADAEANVKFCKQAEDDLKHAKAAALAGTADIDALMKAIDFVSEQVRQKRLTLEKSVKSEKEARKAEIARKAINEFTDHCVALESELDGLKLPDSILRVNFHEPMKGKRTIESLNNAVNTRMADAKIEADQAAKAVRENLALFNKLAGDDYRHLFNDLPVVIHKQKDDFEALIQLRLQQEKERAEAAKKAEEAKPAESIEPDLVEQQAEDQAPSVPQSKAAAKIDIKSHDYFAEWWDEIGSAIAPRDDEDQETHSRRVALAAWEASIEAPPF